MLFQKEAKIRDMTNQPVTLQHSINTDFLPYGPDMPYRIIVENNPINFVDPLGLYSIGELLCDVFGGRGGFCFKDKDKNRIPDVYQDFFQDTDGDGLPDPLDLDDDDDGLADDLDPDPTDPLIPFGPSCYI